MWKLSLPWWEFIARAIVVYIFLLVILRVTGKRQVGQLAPFDLVLLLVLSNALRNSMNGGDNTVPNQCPHAPLDGEQGQSLRCYPCALARLTANSGS
jgi:hypothetical protein